MKLNFFKKKINNKRKTELERFAEDISKSEAICIANCDDIDPMDSEIWHPYFGKKIIYIRQYRRIKNGKR